MSLTILQYFEMYTQDTYASNPYVNDYITSAKSQTSACYYGRNYNQAVALLAAHNITLDTDPARSGSAVSGAVAGKKEGGLSVTFSGAAAAMSIGGDPNLAQTTHGMRLMTLQKGTGPFMGVTGTRDSLVCGGGDPV